jgi:hypothetical protein
MHYRLLILTSACVCVILSACRRGERMHTLQKGGKAPIGTNSTTSSFGLEQHFVTLQDLKNSVIRATLPEGEMVEAIEAVRATTWTALTNCLNDKHGTETHENLELDDRALDEVLQILVTEKLRVSEPLAVCARKCAEGRLLIVLTKSGSSETELILASRMQSKWELLYEGTRTVTSIRDQ